MKNWFVNLFKSIGAWFKKYNWWRELLYVFKKLGGIARRVGAAILNVILTILLVMAVCGVIVGCAFAIYVMSYMDASVDEFDMLTGNQDLSTSVWYQDAEGKLVELTDEKVFSTENRVWVSYSQIPKNLVNAYIAIEDKRFEDHHGVDWTRTISATGYFLMGRSSYGGSTITQQVIKNITGDDETTIQRKIEEIFRALNLEKVKTKQEIMEMYLNTIYLSQGCYGVQAAAYRYFGKSVSDLSLIECAAIAGITQYPTKWDPVLNPENNKYRRDTILEEMLDQGKITKAEFNEAYDKELVLYEHKDEDDTSSDVTSEDTPPVTESVTSWYMDAAIEDAAALLQEHYGVNYQVAIQMVYSGGLQLVLAMDPEIQEIMEKAYADEQYISNLVGASESLIQPQSAMVVIDPKTGNLLGIVGSRGEKTRSRVLNYATQTTRQPGSSIKPLSVYAPALEKGYINYGSVFDDVPVLFNKNGGSYTAWPKNSPARYGGLTPVYDAIARSVNTVAVRVLQKMGLENSFKFITETLDLDTVILNKDVNGLKMSDLTLSGLALGGLTYGVTVRDLTAGYTMFTNEGIYCAPRTVLKILDGKGNVVVDNAPDYRIAISVENAAIMTKMLQGVVSYGTGTAVTLGKKMDVAGKTGTTSSNYDKWFVGYTPYYLGGVWFGYENQQTLAGFSGNPALKIWNGVMTQIHEKILKNAEETGEPLLTFETPPSVIEATFCLDSGGIPTSTCALDPRGHRTATGYFTKDNMPDKGCDTHVALRYCTNGHGLNKCDCPDELTITVARIKVTTRKFPIKVTVADAGYVYSGK